jgi:ABC-type uncharacterized transport system permease subunit
MGIARNYTVRMILAVDSLRLASIAAGMGYGAAIVGGPQARWAAWALLAGWLAHALVLVADMGIGSDGGVRFGFAPVLSLAIWLVVAVHEVESRFVPLPAIRRVLASIALATLLLVLFFPGELPTVPHSPWAPLHWVLGVSAYGLFGAAALHAALLDRADRRMRTQQGSGLVMGMPLLKLERLTFWFVDAGFVVLTGSIAFGIWSTANWRWDHKTVFAVLGWLTFAALIIGRRTRGWRGRQAVRWVYGGVALLMLSYIGSRFVFEVLLHRAAVA